MCLWLHTGYALMCSTCCLQLVLFFLLLLLFFIFLLHCSCPLFFVCFFFRDFEGQCARLAQGIKQETDQVTGKRDLARLSSWFDSFSQQAGRWQEDLPPDSVLI